MNTKGALTDRHGRLLRVGQRVRLIEEYSCASYYVGTRTGTIESLDNTAGSDHQGRRGWPSMRQACGPSGCPTPA
jgi:hypothetical protein